MDYVSKINILKNIPDIDTSDKQRTIQEWKKIPYKAKKSYFLGQNSEYSSEIEEIKSYDNDFFNCEKLKFTRKFKLRKIKKIIF